MFPQVGADGIEARLVEKLKRVIADPEEILFAYNQLFSGGQDVNQAVIEQAKQRVAEAESQIRRLARTWKRSISRVRIKVKGGII